jgi:hypothetical protein
MTSLLLFLMLLGQSRQAAEKACANWGGFREECVQSLMRPSPPPVGRWTCWDASGREHCINSDGQEVDFWDAMDAAIKHRHRSVRRQFQRLHPCPSTQKRSGSCPGYVVDHVIPLACGGADSVLNLQWQTVKAAKLKDKWERKGCPKEQNLECDTNRTKDGHCK